MIRIWGTIACERCNEVAPPKDVRSDWSGRGRPTVRSRVSPMSPLDLDGIEGDLAAVEVALGRLDDGSYWTDEVTGEPLPDELLAERPAARRAAT